MRGPSTIFPVAASSILMTAVAVLFDWMHYRAVMNHHARHGHLHLPLNLLAVASVSSGLAGSAQQPRATMIYWRTLYPVWTELCSFSNCGSVPNRSGPLMPLWNQRDGDSEPDWSESVRTAVHPPPSPNGLTLALGCNIVRGWLTGRQHP